MPSLTVENYVKKIYLIASGTAGATKQVSTGALASAMGVSPGTVTGMLKTLSEASLATYAPYEGAKLTPAGERLALAVLRRHRLLEVFLAKTLDLSWDEVHEEAENMEHAVSDRLIDRIEAFLGHPKVDPHGDPIPAADGSLAETAGAPLASLPRGSRFQVVRVVDQEPTFLRYLTECGIDLGVTGVLEENRLEAGAVVLRVRDRTVALGLEAAGKVLAEKTE